MNDKKVVFMGTPDFSVAVLSKLIENCNVIGVVTQPDKIVGKNKIPTPTPIKKVAIQHNIKVFQPENIKLEYSDILDLNPDIIITCAYGQIIPKEILDYPKYGCINVHASLLPKLRGGAPIHHAIIDGYDKTGITIMYMDQKMDSGDIINQEEIIIDNDMTTSILHDKLSEMGAKLLIETLPLIFNGSNKRIKQNVNEVTFGYNISKEEELIDFSKTTKEVYNQIRGLCEYPGAYTTFDGKVLKVYESKIGKDKNKEPGEIINVYKDGIGVSTVDGEIIFTKIKPFGKKLMTVKDYLNGIKNKEELKGMRFK